MLLFLSIILKKYLTKCLETLINQTYKNWELILVNDGSTNNTLEILKKYEKIDNRIKVIEQENKGPLMARENGIKQSTGDYILFFRC